MELLVTFGQLTWRTPWSAVLAGLALATLVFIQVFTFVSLVFGTQLNPRILQLELRLRRRAAKLCLDDLVQSMALASQNASVDPATTRSVGDYPYVALHAKLVASWASRTDGFRNQLLFWAVGLGGTVVWILINMVSHESFRCVDCRDTIRNNFPNFGTPHRQFAASCITSGALSNLLMVSSQVLVFFTAYAIANQEPAEIAALYCSARSSPYAIAANCPASRSDVLSVIRTHADILGTFTELNGTRAKFLGFEITFSSLRGLLLTLITIGVGLWSVLRNAGVAVTIEQVCP